MHDTVTKLLDYAEGYARAYRGSTYERHAARQALQDELTRLFTPLTDEQIASIEREAWIKYSGTKIAVNTTQGAVMVRMAEKVHGITGEKNDK